MVFYDYENRTALDPYTGAGAPNAVGQVFAKTDTTFSTPLTVVLMGSGLQATDLTTDQYSQLPGFQVDGHLQVVFKSGDFTKVLNTTTPLVGPQGPAVAEAVDNGDNTVTFMLEDGTPAATVTLPASDVPGPPGEKGDKGDKGDTGLPGPDAIPADEAVAAYATTPGTATASALSATIVSEGAAKFSAIEDQATLAGNAVDIARVASAFVRPAGGISISREGSDYRLWHGLGGGLFARFQLQNQTANAGNLPLRQLAGLDTVRAMLETDDAAVPVTGTWVSGSNAGSTGGSYRYSTTAGDTMTFTSPAGATSVGVVVPEITNGGSLMLVEVDGSKTAADRLRTAQEMVDGGLYAASILVTNGGTLNPTDRVMDSYSPTSAATNWAARRVLAADLTSGAHTVKVTNTGYQRGALTAQRAYLTGFLHTLAGTRLTDAGAVVVTDTVLSGVASAWEYAYYGTPAGATAAGEMGNIHGNEAEISLTVKVDGATVTPADGTRTDATREITVTRVTELRHAEVTGPVANVTTTYTLDRQGLRVDAVPTWRVDFTPTWAWLMLAVNGPTTSAAGLKFNRAALSNAPAGPVTLTGTNGDAYYSRSKSVAGWAWNSAGKFAVLGTIPDHTTFLNRWKDAAPAYAQINDRSGSITKLYWARTATGGSTIKAGTTTPSSMRYRVGYFPNGAEAALAAL